MKITIKSKYAEGNAVHFHPELINMPVSGNCIVLVFTVVLSETGNCFVYNR